MATMLKLILLVFHIVVFSFIVIYYHLFQNDDICEQTLNVAKFWEFKLLHFFYIHFNMQNIAIVTWEQA